MIKKICLLIVSIFMTTSLLGQNFFWENLDDGDTLIITKLSLSSSEMDFCPIYSQDILYFSSERKDALTSETALQYNSAVYQSVLQDSAWSKPKKYYFFNTDDHTSLAGCANDGSKIFSYQTFGNGDIYSSALDGNSWDSPIRLSFNSSFLQEQSLAESDQYVVLSREAEDGQFDLYLSNKDFTTDFRSITSLNHPQANELDVSFSPSGGILFFSSNIGGRYKVYFSVLDDYGKFSNPKPLPILSNFEDSRWFFYNDSMFFFTSQEDLYWGRIENPTFIQITDSISVDSVPQEDSLLVQDTVPIVDSLVVIEEVVERRKEIVFQNDTFKQTKFEKINSFLYDSLNFEFSYAQIQIGAYSTIHTVQEFQQKFPAFNDVELIIDAFFSDGKTINRFLIPQKFINLEAAVIEQQKAIELQSDERNAAKRLDAFIAVFNEQGERVVIYFNVETNNYLIIAPPSVYPTKGRRYNF